MKTTIATILGAAAMLWAGGSQTFTGTITDNMCGGSHTAMNMGAPATCIAECVKAGAQYALFDGRQTYTLSDQKNSASLAAKRVTVIGTLDATGKTIRVVSIAAAR